MRILAISRRLRNVLKQHTQKPMANHDNAGCLILIINDIKGLAVSSNIKILIDARLMFHLKHVIFVANVCPWASLPMQKNCHLALS